MPEQTTIYSENGTITIIATMVPATSEEQNIVDSSLQSCGLQLIEEENQ